MTEAGYYINVQYALLICSDCRLPYFPDVFTSHVKKTHNYRMTAEQLQELSDVVLEYGVQQTKEDAINRLPPAPRPPIEGVDLFFDGWTCMTCDYACRSIFSMNNHCSSIHSPKNAFKKRQATVQRLYLAPNIDIYITVEPSIISTTPTDPLALFLKESLPELPITASSVDREIPPWVKKLQWNILVKDQDPRHAIELVRLPRSGEPFSWIQATANRYMEDTRELLTKMDDTTRGWIRSNNSWVSNAVAVPQTNDSRRVASSTGGDSTPLTQWHNTQCQLPGFSQPCFGQCWMGTAM